MYMFLYNDVYIYANSVIVWKIKFAIVFVYILYHLKRN